MLSAYLHFTGPWSLLSRHGILGTWETNYVDAPKWNKLFQNYCEIEFGNENLVLIDEDSQCKEAISELYLDMSMQDILDEIRKEPEFKDLMTLM